MRNLNESLVYPIHEPVWSHQIRAHLALPPAASLQPGDDSLAVTRCEAPFIYC